jgi:hypothetical protein
MILQLKIIFLQIFFLSLIDEILNKLLDQLNINRISGIRPYQISSKAIPYRADIKKNGLSGRISGASLYIIIISG